MPVVEIIEYEADKDKTQQVQDAIDLYRKEHGEPRRVWVSKKDFEEPLEIGGFTIEIRGGCMPGTVMVL